MCYTYDELSRVTKRTLKNSADVPLSEENFTYDAAGNITAAEDDTFVYDVNNRLTSHNGTAVTYDMDGNMLSSGTTTFTYDSSNRLLTAGGHTYTYNGENVRVKDLCGGVETTFVYDTNVKLSRLLVKTTGGTVTKYVYGRGLIGEESGNVFKTYHFDSRGSTVAITNLSGIIIDTFQYDTYGKLISRTGSSSVIFLYNGRDGVVTDSNGLIYMRARYYSPSLRRFINADIVSGSISNAITLNRFAYANGNPVSFIDPFGLSAERGNSDPLYEQLSAMTYEERLEWLREEIKNNPEKYLTYQGNSNSKATSTTSDREKYIYQNAQNALYELLKSWGISLTKTISDQPIKILDAAGVTIKLTIDVSFETPWDTNVKSDFSTSSGYAIHEAKTPEIKLLGTNFGAQLGVYVDEERLSVGTSSYSSIDGWEYSSKRQMGVYSEAYITSVSYAPDDKYLPTVTVTLDYEINHLTKIVGGGLIAAAVVAPQLTFAVIPTLSEFIQQLGSLTPAFAH